LIVTSAPAFAADGDGGSPSSTSGTATPTVGNPPNNPAASRSNPRRMHARTAMNTKSTHVATGATPAHSSNGTGSTAQPATSVDGK
jgi:hypothetical protein